MSVAEHEQTAVEAEADAAVHDSQYDPDAIEFDYADCSVYCFRSNPTAHHWLRANQLRREAARHREASAELRAAEERACQGVPALHRDFSPFYHRANITGADLTEEGPLTVHFDAIGETMAPQLQALVDCHLARNAALGYVNEEMAACPLAVRGIHAQVVKTDDGFDVQLEASDSEARAEALTRIRALLEP